MGFVFAPFRFMVKGKEGIETCHTIKKQKRTPIAQTVLLSVTYSPFFLSDLSEGWACQGQHGKADILRPVSAGETRPYWSLPV